MGLFYEFREWLAENEDLLEEVARGMDTYCLSCDGTMLCQDEECDLGRCRKYQRGPCHWCDGTGKRSESDIREAAEKEMNTLYQKKLEKDYRLAVQMLSQSVPS